MVMQNDADLCRCAIDREVPMDKISKVLTMIRTSPAVRVSGPSLESVSTDVIGPPAAFQS